MKKRLTVTQAAQKMGVSVTTIYGLIGSGEISAEVDKDGRKVLSEAALKTAPRRHRGRPLMAADDLYGKKISRLIDLGYSPAGIATRLQISKQAVSKNLLRYRGRL